MGNRSDGTTKRKTKDMRIGGRTQRVFARQLTMPVKDLNILKAIPLATDQNLNAVVGDLVCGASSAGFKVDPDQARADARAKDKDSTNNNYSLTEIEAMERLSEINPGVMLGLILAQLARRKWESLALTPAEREELLNPKPRRGQSLRAFMEENDPLFHLR